MAQIARRTDVIETKAASALSYAIGAVVAFAIGGVLFAFRGEGLLIGLCWVLFAAGLGMAGFAGYLTWLSRQVTSFTLECIFCHEKFDLTEKPGDEDVTCPHCHRLIPILDDKPLPVDEVRCGFCNALNFYSSKTQFLICESCDREIPVTLPDNVVPKHAPRGYVVNDDTRTYELTLDSITNPEHPVEGLISALQSMLALNRSQVKQLLAEVPTVLLVGIPLKKAEMLRAQLEVHGATASFVPMD